MDNLNKRYFINIISLNNQKAGSRCMITNGYSFQRAQRIIPNNLIQIATYKLYCLSGTITINI